MRFLQAKLLGIVEKLLQKRKATFSDDIVVVVDVVIA